MIRVLAITLLILAGPIPYLQPAALAVQITEVWGGGNGDWDDPNGTGAFWDPDNENGPTNGDEPGVTYIVKIDNGNEAANSAVTVNQNVDIDRLEISTLDTLTTTFGAFGIGVQDGAGNFTGGGLVNNSGMIVIQDTGSLVVGGKVGVFPPDPGIITNNGTILLSTGAAPTFNVLGDVQLGGTGALTMMGDDPDLAIRGSGNFVGSPSADKLFHLAGHTIQGIGQIGVGTSTGTMNLSNAGLIDANVFSPLGDKLIIHLTGAGTNENSGTLRASNGGTLRITNSPFDNTGGVIEARDGSLVEVAANGTTITGGTLTTSGTGVIRFVSGSNGLDGVTIASTVELAGAAAATVELVGSITNNGTLRMDSVGTPGKTILLNSGNVTLQGVGTLEMSDSTGNLVRSNNACCVLTNETDHTIQGAGSLGVGSGGDLLPLTNRGTIIANGTNPLVIKTTVGGFSNESTGILQINAGSTLDVNQSFTSTGTISGGGTLELPSTKVLTNSGQVDPGASAGMLTIGSHYTQTASGALNIELGGSDTGRFDKLVITGTATLAGTLEVTLINGFIPDAGQTFEVMTFASRTGDFTEKNLDLGQGRYATAQYSATGLTLTIHALDHYLCYNAKTTRGTPPFVRPAPVTLKDQFEEVTAEVLKPVSLCTPVDKNAEGIVDAATHLEGYQIRQPKGAKPGNLEVQNQFQPSPNGVLVVDTITPDRLLVPTAKSLVSQPPAPNPMTHEVDHYKCYKVKEDKASEFTPIGDVLLKDQFIEAQLGGEPKLFDLKKPTRLCNPVEKNGEEIKHPVNHLVCYKAALVQRQPKHTPVPGLFVNNQFGPERIDTIKEEELCVPSSKIL
jgi:hypothetical protein